MEELCPGETMKRTDKTKMVLVKNGEERQGCRMEKGDGLIWIIVIALVIFATASFFLYIGP